MRRLLSLALVIVLPASASAQIIRRGGMPFQEPSTFVSFGVGLLQPWGLADGTTSSTWDFSDATQFAVALEKNFGAGASLGVRGTTARVPLRYTSVVGGDAISATDADANVSQLLGSLHIASGGQFHTVLELSAGATMYYNFRARGSDASIGPRGADTDFSFGFGYGVGYNLTPRFSVDVVQDQITTLHQKTGLSAGQSSSARLTATRIVARFGLGARTR
ncbi:MAG TPA: hypothetical protein VF034_06525 [Gemmatimonadaceae bacterium]